MVSQLLRRIPSKASLVFGICQSFLICHNVLSQSNHQFVIRQAVVDTMKSLYNNLERPNNRGFLIDKINKTAGAPKGSAYCSSGIIYIGKCNKLPVTATPRALSWLKASAVKRRHGKAVTSEPVVKGDIALFNWSKGQWHVEVVTQWNIAGDKTRFRTGGFNTGSPYDPKRRKQGIFPHLRRKQDAIILNYQEFWKLNSKEVKALNHWLIHRH